MTALSKTKDPKERLIRAANNLAEATHNEHIAIVKYTDTLDDLKFAITQLENSCLTFQAVAKRLDVSKLRRRSLRLARIMS